MDAAVDSLTEKPPGAAAPGAAAPDAAPGAAEAAAPIACSSPLETLSCLLKSVENLNASLELEAGLEGVAERLRRSIPFDTFAVLLFDELGRDLRFRFALGVDAEIVEHWRFGRGQGIVGTVAATGETRVARDVRLEPRYVCLDHRVLSEVAVPLVSKQRTIGVLDVCSFREDFFTAEHLQVLQLVAGHLATAIENSRLYANLRRQTQILSALHEASRELTAILDRRELLARVGGIVARQVRYSVFSVLLWDEKAQELRAVMTEGPESSDGGPPGRCSKHALHLGQGICGTAAALRQSVRVPNVEVDPRFERCGHASTRSELVVPLLFKDRLVGVIDLESDQYNAFCESDEQFLSTLSSYLAIALENATLYERLREDERKLARDLATARGIQKFLLPNKTPWVPGLQVAAAYTPARDLGGDIYDILPYGGRRTAIAVGDVAGKGTAAALYGSLVIGQLRGYVAESCGTPLEVLAYLNEELTHLEIERRFVAMTFAVYDHDRRTLTLANAGLHYPCLVRRGEIREIALPGVSVGSMKAPVFRQEEIELQDGDVLVFTSDGIVELLDGGHEKVAME
jgi:sigma-B regulation protein RsbU (phosphoserine phosphatase)